MKNYRKLTSEEMNLLKAQMCTATDWDAIEVAEDFSPEYVLHTRFSGNIRIGSFNKEFELAGGIRKHSGLYHTTLHNVTVGDDCCIENVKNYIANYEIGHDTFIENVDIILTDCVSTFGNGVEVAVLNETGGREVMIFDRLTAQTAYVMALYRHRPEMIARLREMIGRYVDSVSSSVGKIGSNVTIVDSGYIKNVKIGDSCKIEGASRLKNGSINSNDHAPVQIGVGVVGDDFIISSGSSVKDGVTFSRCFIGQACKLGHNYSASDSLFFSNCQGENGEACAIFAGPYTVTHHKSTLLIAGMFSFMNAGSGSNQSNHMYKLGPIHQGIMERGAKTASDSYILWPAKVGAFSLVMGRHVSHQDTSNLPFSYLIEQQNTSFIMPGANLKSVGTIRDARKWPGRDGRQDPDKLDQINFNLLSPYTIHKMLNGVEILKELQKVSGVNSDAYTYQSGKIKRSSLKNGLKYYGMAIDKFLGNSLITRIMNSKFSTIEELRQEFVPKSAYGEGDWVDLSGLIAPKEAVTALLDDIQSGALTDIHAVNERFARMHELYYYYEWKWAYKTIQDYYGVDLQTITAEKLMELVSRWRDSVVGLDNLIYEDARKEFSLSAMTSFGADGDETERKEDFMQVRGSFFEADPFVTSVKEHIRVKSALGESAIEILSRL
ncbi:MAG: DUF4954 family protein [Bacteroidales bacterium]|nr:DUF4954 family protein [Bacteroidales bacterium]